ncbi:MAG: nucleotidyltransferase domain-containing protein [Promethearchaeota archaeon]
MVGERLEAIRSEILEKIRPTHEENQQISSIISELTDILKEWNESHEKYPFAFISPQGSTGIKQTHLRNDSDIDLFIFLNPEDYREIINASVKNRTKISALFRKYCDDWVIPALRNKNYNEFYIAYAEHPYVSSTLQGYDIDIVFSFILSEERIKSRGPITAVDRTFYHSKFINERLTPSQIDDVRILKRFFKKNFSYGDKAPIARGGFIGYAAELWIHHFGDIWSYFRNFKDLPYTAIDFFNRSTKNLRDIPRFQKDFILLIDPTDKKRNVASSISERGWIYCLKQINEFLSNPDPKILSQKLLPSFEISQKEINQHFVVIETLQISDSHYTKIRDKLYSIAESMKSEASREFDQSIRFPDINYSIFFNSTNKRFSLTFYTSTFQIDESYQRQGPSVDRIRNFEKFQAKHPDLIIKEGYGYVNESRKFTDFLTMINAAFNERMFKEIELVNISLPRETQFEESLMAIYVLKECILPYQVELDQIKRKVIPKKSSRKR